MKHQTLEQRLENLLPNWEAFDVQFHELWGDGDGGWSVNDSWTPYRGCSRAEAISYLRARWEVFKVNYLPKARVRDLTGDGNGDDWFPLEVDCTSFATLTKSE